MVDNKQGLEERLNKFLDKNDRHIVCSNCGTINNGINTFCTNCKQSFDKEKQKCPRCLKNIKFNDTKCENCGLKLDFKKKSNNNSFIWMLGFFVISGIYFYLSFKDPNIKFLEQIIITLFFYVVLTVVYWFICWGMSSSKPTAKTITQQTDILKQKKDINNSKILL